MLTDRAPELHTNNQDFLQFLNERNKASTEGKERNNNDRHNAYGWLLLRALISNYCLKSAILARVIKNQFLVISALVLIGTTSYNSYSNIKRKDKKYSISPKIK